MLVSLASGWIVAVGTIVVAIDAGDDEDWAATFAGDLHGQDFADEGEECGWRVAWRALRGNRGRQRRTAPRGSSP